MVVGDVVQMGLQVMFNEVGDIGCVVLQQFLWYGDYFGVEFVDLQFFGVE